MHKLMDLIEHTIAKYKIIMMNVNSIISNYKRSQLLELINSKKPDIVLINETKLNKRHTLYFKNYDIVRNDRESGTKGGGTAIIIKKGIKFSHLHFVQHNKILENTTISIKLKNNEILYLVSIYAKKGRQSEFHLELNYLFNQLELHKLTNYYIIAGDFNAKHTEWANTENNERGIKLKEWIDDNDIHYKIRLYNTDAPSYPRGESFIDLVMADARVQLTTNQVGNLYTFPFDSDHKAISFSFYIDE